MTSAFVGERVADSDQHNQVLQPPWHTLAWCITLIASGRKVLVWKVSKMEQCHNDRIPIGSCTSPRVANVTRYPLSTLFSLRRQNNCHKRCIYTPQKVLCSISMLSRSLFSSALRTSTVAANRRLIFAPIARSMSQKTLFQAIKEDHEEVCVPSSRLS